MISGPQINPPKQTQRGESPQQVRHDDEGVKSKGDGPHPERRLKDDKSQKKEGERSPHTESQDKNEEAEGAGRVAMDHLTERLSELERTFRRESGIGGLGGNDHPAVATGPIGTSKPGVRQPDVGPEDNDDESDEGCDKKKSGHYLVSLRGAPKGRRSNPDGPSGLLRFARNDIQTYSFSNKGTCFFKILKPSGSRG